ncbi:MAG: ABC transporter permease [Synergistaceae bacterium]|nr:ABC transporter permease [Synergistaceae bacterium]
MIVFVLKGLLRDRSRSLFPVLMVTAGVFLTVVLYGFMQGVLGDLGSSTAKYDTEHVKITTHAWQEMADQTPNDLALMDADNIMAQLRQSEKDMFWTGRIRFGGLLDVPDAGGETRAQGPVTGLAIDLLGRDSPEKSIFDLEAALVRGRLPEERGEILISENFAGKLAVGPGDTVTLIGSTMYGAMAISNFSVAGTLSFGVVALDRGMILVDLRDAQAALDMEDAVSEIVGFSRDMVYSKKEMESVASDFNDRFSNGGDQFSPFMVTLGQQNGLDEYLAYADSMGLIIVAIFVVAMSIVLWNSGLMNGLRRYGEIGVRLAMGEGKGRLYRWMVFESLIIGLVGSGAGTALGLAVTAYLQYHGLDFGSFLSQSSLMLPNVFRARVTPASYAIGFFPGVFASVLGALFAGIGIFRRQTAQLMKELES